MIGNEETDEVALTERLVAADENTVELSTTENDTNATDNHQDDNNDQDDQEMAQLIDRREDGDNNNLMQQQQEDIAMMVRVRAPATLPEGYTFVAEINENPLKTFTCRVPEGGIEEGVLFWVPLPASFPDERLHVPFGHWKDGIFDCCSLGLCHAHLWCSWLCPQLQLAQIMMRLQLTCFGQPASPHHTRNSFTIVMGCVVCYAAFSTAIAVAEWPWPYDKEAKTPAMLEVIKTVGYVVFTLWTVYALTQTRQMVRRHYNIPGSQCNDVCCSLMCTCCTLAQLARHTGDYETYPGVCCTETGHAPSAPLVV